MKKLIGMLAAIAFAAVAQASSVNWSVTYATGLDDAGLTSGAYWVVQLASESTAGIAVTTGGELVLDASVGTVVGTGSISDPEGVADTIENVTASMNGTYYTLVIVDGENSMYGVADAVALSGVQDAPPVNGNPIEFTNGSDDLGTVMWADTATIGEVVPEPTSGLLMLLGMAGLALRRRRA